MNQNNRRRGIEVGDAAITIIQQREGKGTIDDLIAALSHLQGTKAELLEALAYAAAQVYAYQKISNEDAHLAILNIESSIRNYRERRPT